MSKPRRKEKTTSGMRVESLRDYPQPASLEYVEATPKQAAPTLEDISNTTKPSDPAEEPYISSPDYREPKRTVAWLTEGIPRNIRLVALPVQGQKPKVRPLSEQVVKCVRSRAEAILGFECMEAGRIVDCHASTTIEISSTDASVYVFLKKMHEEKRGDAAMMASLLLTNAAGNNVIANTHLAKNPNKVIFQLGRGGSESCLETLTVDEWMKGAESFTEPGKDMYQTICSALMSTCLSDGINTPRYIAWFCIFFAVSFKDMYDHKKRRFSRDVLEKHCTGRGMSAQEVWAIFGVWMRHAMCLVQMPSDHAFFKSTFALGTAPHGQLPYPKEKERYRNGRRFVSCVLKQLGTVVQTRIQSTVVDI